MPVGAVQAIRTFEAVGVEFIEENGNGTGVRLKKGKSNGDLGDPGSLRASLNRQPARGGARAIWHQGVGNALRPFTPVSPAIEPKLGNDHRLVF